LIDNANKRQGKFEYPLLRYSAKILWKLSLPGKTHQMSAGWYGNDTCWRMVMDINKIAIYGQKDRKIYKTPQRKIYTLCDGIIGGQGDGPLNPQPLPLGVICFSDCSPIVDICMATLMCLDIHKIPLLKSALLTYPNEHASLFLNGQQVTIKDLENLSTPTLVPVGWLDYLKKG
jgi:hypothetical protein